MRALLLLLALLWSAVASAQGTALRVKDLGKVQGWRENVLVGTGIVTGLAGTGDSPGNRATRQALSNVLAQFNLTVAPEQVNSSNVAVVMVSASLPAFCTMACCSFGGAAWAGPRHVAKRPAVARRDSNEIHEFMSILC